MSTDAITNSEDWLEVRVGDTCTVIGRLDAVSFGGQGCLLLAFPDWTTLPIRCNPPEAVRALVRQPVKVRCMRDEDGLEGRVVWSLMGNAVPIPVVSGNLT